MVTRALQLILDDIETTKRERSTFQGELEMLLSAIGNDPNSGVEAAEDRALKLELRIRALGKRLDQLEGERFQSTVETVKREYRQAHEAVLTTAAAFRPAVERQKQINAEAERMKRRRRSRRRARRTATRGWR
jgi:small-conductance mechanosensitive channel